MDENCQVIKHSGDLESLAKFIAKTSLYPKMNDIYTNFSFYPGLNKILLIKDKVVYNFVPTDITAKGFNLLHQALKELQNEPIS